MKTKLGRVGVTLLIAGGLAACDGVVDDGGVSPGEVAGDTASWAGEICYRGERAWAEKVEGSLVIEGDILVTREDQWCETNAAQAGDPELVDGDISVQRRAVRIQGAGFQWPGGVVPYAFDSTFVGGDQTTAIAAMDEWQAYVPTLRFVARTTQPDYINFVKTASICNSPVGHGSGERTINLTAGCIGSHSLHHEIGHTLGLYHQQTRKDRNTYVTVVWNNILGCPSTATQFSHCGQAACAANIADCGCSAKTDGDKTCYKAHNFDTDSKRSNIGAYDYDSLMHYGAADFNKGPGVTLQVLMTDAAGNPFPIGQRTHMSDGDLYAMHAMYPSLAIPRSTFQGRGSQRVCALAGRTQDIAVRFRMAGSSAGITSSAIDRSLGLGDYTVACKADSSFWAGNYDYPNSTTPLSISATLDSYSGQNTMRVLSPSLLAVY